MTATPPPDRSRPQVEQEEPAGTLRHFFLQLSRDVTSDPLVPADLARALAHVLPVQAAGIALLFDDLRLPLGASNDAARRAEQIQATLGAGPCVDAARAQAQIVADQAQLDARWPLYADNLREQTPFRAVAAVPLPTPGNGQIAALNLFSTEPDLSARLDLHQLGKLATLAGALLTTCLDQIRDIADPEAGPSWYREATQQRHDVWIATGMLMAQHHIRRIDALDLLRGHAYSHDTTLDQLAADLAHGRITPDEISS